MTIFGYVISGISVIMIVAFLAGIFYWLYRKVMEHMFREYERWRRQDLPKNSHMVSYVRISPEGEFEMRVDNRYGYMVVRGSRDDSISKIMQQIQEHATHMRHDVAVVEGEDPKQSTGSVWLRFDEVQFVFPVSVSAEDQ